MIKKIFLIILIAGLVMIIFIIWKNSQHKDSNYYLTSPWVTERIDWYFLQLPEKWTENLTEIEKGKEKYKEISNDMRMYEMNLKDFHFVCTYMDAKDGFYENWDLNISATATLNQVLYNLKCKDIKIDKLSPHNNFEEIKYRAISNCSKNKYKAKMRGFKNKNHILMASVYYVDSDKNLEKIAERIMDKIENKYDEIENAKN